MVHQATKVLWFNSVLLWGLSTKVMKHVKYKASLSIDIEYTNVILYIYGLSKHIYYM